MAQAKGLRAKAREEEREAARPLPSTVYEDVSLADMRPAEYNPRSIDEDAKDHLNESLQRFGLVQPIVWNRRTGCIVGGHQKYEFLLSKKAQTTRAVVVDLDEAEERLLNITLNNPRAQGYFQSDVVSELLEDMKKSVAAIEFDALGLGALGADFKFISPNEEDEDDDPTEGAEEPVKKVSGHAVRIKFPTKKAATEFFDEYGIRLNGASEVYFEEMEKEE